MLTQCVRIILPHLYLQSGPVDAGEVLSLLLFPPANLVSEVVQSDAVLVRATTYLRRGKKGCQKAC